MENAAIWAVAVDSDFGRGAETKLAGHVIGTRSQVDAFVAEENACKAAERGRFTCGRVAFRVLGEAPRTYGHGPLLADFARCACGTTAYRCDTCGGWAAQG